ncbi:MAG: protein kinase [Nannocystaceae bacterium]|nr:protein kinase [Nannocystaceae bacterium]
MSGGDDVDGLFLELVELSPDEREAALAARRAEQPALVAEVEALLDADAVAEGFLEPVDVGLADAPVRTWLEGRTVGQYRIERVIGLGGMSTVYLAWQRAPRRQVALKLLRAGFDADALRRRFVQEAEILGQLRHPGIAEVYEAATYDSELGPLPYFAMELIPGARSITAWAEQDRIDRDERVRMMVAVCRAVQHAHDHGVVHRDLKPSNILVGDDGRAKLIDFGVARLLDASGRGATVGTRVGELVGTLQYMSPEQLDGDNRRVDARTDVYALGLVLYELVAGRLPYAVPEATAALVAARVRAFDPPAPTALRGPRARALDAVVLTALAKDPAARHATAAALADELERALRGEGVQSIRSQRARNLRRLASRSQRLLPAALATGGLVAAAAAWRLRVRDDSDHGSASAPSPSAGEYLHHIARAERAVASGDLAQAKQALGACAPAQRRWEWHRMLAQLDGSAQVMALGSAVRRIALDRTHTRLFAITEDGRVHGWRRRSGDEVGFDAQWRVDTGDDLGALAIDTAGARVFAGGDQRVVHAVGFDGDGERTMAQGASTIFGLAYADARAELVVTRQDGSLERWDPERGTRSFAVDTGLRLGAPVVQGETVLAVASPGAVRLALDDGHVLRSWSDPQGPEVALSVGDALYTAGWQRHVLAHERDGDARRWPEQGDGIVDLVAIDDVRIAAAGRDGRVTIWDRGDASIVRTLVGHDFAVEALAGPIDARWLVSGSADGTLRLWDLEAPDIDRVWPVDDKIHALAFTPDGRGLVVGAGPHWGRDENDAVMVFDTLRGDIVARSDDHRATVDAVAISPDGRTIATAARDGEIALRDADGLAARVRIAAHVDGVTAVVFSPHGDRLASVAPDGVVATWRVDDGSAISRTDAGIGPLTDARWDDAHVVAVGKRGMVRCDAACTATSAPDASEVTALARLDDDTWVIGTQTGSIAAIDRDGRTRWQASAFGRTVTDVAVAPGGDRIAVASLDAKIRLHDSATGELVLTVGAHDTRATTVAFSPDGRTIASGGFDRRVRLWHAPTASADDAR